MNPKILVTGAPGNVGSEVVKGLQQAGVEFRIGAFDMDLADKTFGTDNEIVRFDFLDPSTYRQTFDGIERMFLVRPPLLSNVKRDIAPALWAAVGAGVQHIVFLSIQGVEKNRVVPHYKIEQLILRAGVDFTFLRAGFFMQNLSTTHAQEIRELNKIPLPVGKAKTSFIDVRDIASAAVVALTEDGHKNKTYTVTGAEALDYYTVADKLSDELGRRITYTNPSVFSFIHQQLKRGSKLGYVLVVTALYTITRFGNASEITEDIETLLGRPPITFDRFIQDYRDSWLNAENSNTSVST